MFKDSIINTKYIIPDSQISRVAGSILQIKGIYKVFIDPISKKKITLQTIGDCDTDLIIQQVNQILDKVLDELGMGKFHNSEQNHLNHLTSCCQRHNEQNIAEQLISEDWIKLLKGSNLLLSNRMNNLLLYLDSSYVTHIKKICFVTDEIHTYPFFSEYYAEKLELLKNHPEMYFIASHINIDGALQSYKKIFQTAPCMQTYFSLENSEIAQERIFLVKGLCFRNEIRNLYFLERMDSFTQREFVFFGDNKFILDSREIICRETINWMNDIGISGQCQLANDPFFINDKTKSNFNIPQEVKFEFQADIPYKHESISIASFDTHGDFFSKNLNIKFNNQHCWSACIGLGIERAAWAFLQQHGLNLKNWPAHVRASVE
jgi:hypothetical protein